MSVSTSIQSITTGITPHPVTIDAKSYLRYIARQPILDREQKTYGYELLFRSGPENVFRCDDGDVATCNTIDFSLLFGATALTGGHPAFINCTRNVLLRDIVTLLPRDRAVIEVLEHVIADEETLAACDRLRRAGYKIVLDDFEPTPNTIRLLPFADMVKVDFLATDSTRQAAIAADMRRRGIKLVAEKIETVDHFQLALKLGYHYFQGYFFCKPQNITMVDVPVSRFTYIHVLSIATRDTYDVVELERAILQEPSLCYRLLRYLNSAAFGLFPVRSIRHAISMLGQSEIRKWILIVVAIAVSCDRPSELILSALTRARTCEALASLTGEDTNGAFMVGLMSLMDAILDSPMEAVIAQLPLTADCKEALCGSTSGLGRLLHLAICCERGAWNEISEIAAASTLTEAAIWDVHREACHWSDQTLQVNQKQQ